jgi:hypothetical protein
VNELDLRKIESSEIDLKQTLGILVSSFERSLAMMEEDRNRVLDQLKTLQRAHSESLAFSPVSEDGILEKSINDNLKILNEMAKRNESVARMIMKLITTKMEVEAIMAGGEKTLGKPIDISKLKG